MLPWLPLATAPLADGGVLRLKRRGSEFSIMLGSNELMNSRLSGSETALANLSLSAFAVQAAPAVLIGGLGMGFTLRAALQALGPGASVVVAELVPEVIEWARGPMADLFGASLSDPRLRIARSDVADLIRASGADRQGGTGQTQHWDAILLDVDNGPDGLTQDSNDWLYGPAGLSAAHAGLRPGGVLGVWSAHPDTGFRRRMAQAGFAVTEHKVRAHGSGGAKHIIWLGRR
ncbi:MAG: spermidine synthase [Beijerinckiaceae bacterium]|jgi:spermidine synthase|nr:spermidine synthase [Beijerinckiaceae bacterium]